MRCAVEAKKDGEREDVPSPPFFSFCCDDWLPGRCRWTHHLSYISIINARWQRHASRAMDMISPASPSPSLSSSPSPSLSRQKTFKKQLGYSKVSRRIRHCLLCINTDAKSVEVDRLIFEYHSSTRKGKSIGKNNSFQWRAPRSQEKPNEWNWRDERTIYLFRSVPMDQLKWFMDDEREESRSNKIAVLCNAI